jgi:hypothetical protein
MFYNRRHLRRGYRGEVAVRPGCFGPCSEADALLAVGLLGLKGIKRLPAEDGVHLFQG